MEIIFHYPPELLDLLVDVIPRLCKSKKDVITFFHGAGTPRSLYDDLAVRVSEAPEGLSKFEIARMILIRLNEKGEVTLRERREILKRVVEFENFSSCWPNDRLAATGLVAQIQKVVQAKDSFTRMSLEREQEVSRHREQRTREHQELLRLKGLRAEIKRDLFALFADTNAQGRGKSLEGVLNRLFSVENILIREAFALCGDSGEGIVQQIDGAIEMDGFVYLVEMKWWSAKLGPKDISQHLLRVINRDGSRGIFISNAGYTDAAILECKQVLPKRVVLLCDLEEFVLLLEKDESVTTFLKTKVNAAIADSNPMFRPAKSW